MSSFSTKGAIPPLPDVLIYLYTRAGCTSIASILTGDTRMLVGLGSECGNVLLMEALKSWLLIGRANLVSTNGQVGSLFNARAVKIKQPRCVG